ADLALSIASSPGSQPAALQWTLTYSPAEVAAVSATAGPAAAAAGKSIACANKDGSYTCVLFGLNQQTMPNGVAAVVRVTPATAGSASIGVANTLGASQDGTGLAIAGNGGTVSVTSGGPGIGLSGL